MKETQEFVDELINFVEEEIGEMYHFSKLSQEKLAVLLEKSVRKIVTIMLNDFYDTNIRDNRDY
jgi:predicted house-cleaning noncanonical NTP pyrophosphatase (MazG superfamily)